MILNKELPIYNIASSFPEFKQLWKCCSSFNEEMWCGWLECGGTLDSYRIHVFILSSSELNWLLYLIIKIIMINEIFFLLVCFPSLAILSCAGITPSLLLYSLFLHFFLFFGFETLNVLNCHFSSILLMWNIFKVIINV